MWLQSPKMGIMAPSFVHPSSPLLPALVLLVTTPMVAANSVPPTPKPTQLTLVPGRFQGVSIPSSPPMPHFQAQPIVGQKAASKSDYHQGSLFHPARVQSQEQLSQSSLPVRLSYQLPQQMTPSHQQSSQSLPAGDGGYAYGPDYYRRLIHDFICYLDAPIPDSVNPLNYATEPHNLTMKAVADRLNCSHSAIKSDDECQSCCQQAPRDKRLSRKRAKRSLATARRSGNIASGESSLAYRPRFTSYYAEKPLYDETAQKSDGYGGNEKDYQGDSGYTRSYHQQQSSNNSVKSPRCVCCAPKQHNDNQASHTYGHGDNDGHNAHRFHGYRHNVYANSRVEHEGNGYHYNEEDGHGFYEASQPASAPLRAAVSAHKSRAKRDVEYHTLADCPGTNESYSDSFKPSVKACGSGPLRRECSCSDYIHYWICDPKSTVPQKSDCVKKRQPTFFAWIMDPDLEAIPLLVIAVGGALVALIIVLCAIVVLCYCRYRRRRHTVARAYGIEMVPRRPNQP